MRIRPVSVLVSFFSLTFADVEFTKPGPGTTTPEGAIAISWQEGSGAVPLAQLTNWQLFLVAGGDTDAATVCNIT